MHIHWSAREVHENNLLKAHEETGRLDSRGNVRQYNGAKFWEMFNALGHDSTVIERCKCHTEIFYKE